VTEAEAATAIIQTVRAAKATLGKEQTMGMLLGFVMGEIQLSGGTKEDLDRLINETWQAFLKEQEKAKAGG
jgi:hypothetical protein